MGTSRLHRRLQRVCFAIDSSTVAPLAQRRFGRAVVWQPCAEEWQLLQHDWEDLMGAIGSGRGGNVSAREGQIIQLRPKASDASVRTLVPGAQGVQMSLPLGFYMRAHITHRILSTGQLSLVDVED